MAGNKSIALVSGGIDSVTALYMCDIDVEAVMFIDYGQLIMESEFEMSRRHARLLGKQFIKLDLKSIFKEFGGAVFNPDSEDTASLDVPNRNMIFFSVAVAHAIKYDYDSVITGIFATDYGDTSESFIGHLGVAVSEASEGKVSISSPLLGMHKSEVITNAISLGIDLFKDTHSCHRYNIPSVHCGVCDSCISRRNSFKYLSIEDETKYLR